MKWTLISDNTCFLLFNPNTLKMCFTRVFYVLHIIKIFPFLTDLYIFPVFLYVFNIKTFYDLNVTNSFLLIKNIQGHSYDFKSNMLFHVTSKRETKWCYCIFKWSVIKKRWNVNPCWSKNLIRIVIMNYTYLFLLLDMYTIIILSYTLLNHMWQALRQYTPLQWIPFKVLSGRNEDGVWSGFQDIYMQPFFKK